MAFQRSFSRVWWGSENQLPNFTSNSNTGSSFTSGGYYYNSFQQQGDDHHLSLQPEQKRLHHPSHRHQFQPFSGSGYHSLDYNSVKMFSGNLSHIQEVEDEQQNISKLSWEKHDSPGSLRSQDSGFSDNDESHSTRSLGGRSSKNASPSTKSDKSRNESNEESTSSPVSTRTIATPPTVIRRVGKSEFYSPLVSVSRRISFSGSPATLKSKSSSVAASSSSSSLSLPAGRKENVGSAIDVENADIENSNYEGETLLAQLDSIQLLNSTPQHIDVDAEADAVDDIVDVIGEYEVISAGDINEPTDNVQVKGKTKRRRRIVRTATKPLTMPTKRRTLPKEITNEGSSRDDDNDKLLDATDDDDGNENENENEKDNHDDADCGRFDEGHGDDVVIRTAERRRNEIPAYNNETVYFGASSTTTTTPIIQSYNNETIILDGLIGGSNDSTLKLEDVSLNGFGSESHQQHTSTPKATKAKNSQQFLNTNQNPLLNGHSPSLQHWLYELKSSYDHEVMSTLQTKSIVQEAFKNLTITTNTVAKLIRQLQQRALYMQSDFERIERILTYTEPSTLQDALSSAEQLIANIGEFTRVLERRAVFFNSSRSRSRCELKRYEENLDQIKMITKDTRYSLERHHYINLECLLDDLQVLKRYLLIALRQVFERMVRIIVQSIEQGRCDLMLRANINMVATLTNIDYEGFASLTDAFVQNEAVRALLIVCLEHRLSSVRAMALRALATICSAPAAIAQLSACDGIEIVRDILQVQSSAMESATAAGKAKASMSGSLSRKGGVVKRGAVERREAVSLLTQLTAAWHGPEHRLNGLKDCVESIVAGLTQLVTEPTSCSQTLLLCAAALNNLSRMEMTSHYSIMSNVTIFKLIETVEAKQNKKRQQLADDSRNHGADDDVSIFLYEQIIAMLYNMSLNKKCHSHLANGCIINFITSAYEMEFYKTYDSRAESDAQRRTIKAILHTLTRLVHDSNGGSLGLELLQQQRIPAVLFNKTTTTTTTTSAGTNRENSSSNTLADHHHHEVRLHLSRDIELLVRQLELAQRRAQKRLMGDEESPDDESFLGGNNSSGLKFNLTKHESFV